MAQVTVTLEPEDLLPTPDPEVDLPASVTQLAELLERRIRRHLERGASLEMGFDGETGDVLIVTLTGPLSALAGLDMAIRLALSDRNVWLVRVPAPAEID
jgi:hypothetical protein